MQRFVNDPDYIVEDMVKGYVKAHKDLIKRSEANDRVVQYVNAPVEGKVGLVTGVFTVTTATLNASSKLTFKAERNSVSSAVDR